MATETYLVRLRESVSKDDIKFLESMINRCGGNIEAILKNGIVLIISLESSYVDVIRNLSSVELVGGVVFKGRKLRRYRKKERPR
jgi:cob(I)alamin adenosyltransferase